MGWLALCFTVQITRTHSRGHVHLAYFFAHSIEYKDERVGNAHSGKSTTERATLQLKLCFLINSCITASCLPQESDHTPETGALNTVDLWLSQMVCV